MLRKEKLVSVIHLAAAVCLFLAPWAFEFAKMAIAARSAWISAAALAVFALAALFGGGEIIWTGGAEGIIGLWTITAPCILGFAAERSAMWSHVIVGLPVVAMATITLIWPRLPGSGRRVKCAALLLACLVCIGAAAHAAVKESYRVGLGSASDAAFTTALNVLAANGWHDVNNLHRQGRYVRATTQTMDGRRETVLVDPDTGIILPDIEGIEGS